MWQNQENQLYKQFKFDNYVDAVAFIDKVATIAEQANHHPAKIALQWGLVEVWLCTHDAGDVVTERDKALSSELDKLQIREDKQATIESEIERAKLYTDGGSRGNPGPSALGFVILDMEDSVVKKASKYLGITTNNQAEYQGLKYGLEQAKDLGIKELAVYMDSLLVVNQMIGSYKVKNQDLWQIHQSAKELASSFEHISYIHVPRELNSIADGLVNDCLDSN